MISWVKNLPDDAVFDTLDSPVGKLLMVASRQGIHALTAAEGEEQAEVMSAIPRDPEHPLLRATRAQLAEYFVGRRRRFDLPVVLEGTIFEKQAWGELRKIPYGETISYGEQARRIGRPGAMRAVGGANGRNPVSIVVPCHRVIGTDGSLTGFGWGVHKKQALLELERLYS